MVKETKTNQDFDINELAEAQKGICKSVVGNLNNQNTPKTQEERAKFKKKKLAEACDGRQNAVVNQLCNENLPKKLLNRVTSFYRGLLQKY